ncbi:HAD family hydrolase [Tengunoibacter tsumagoiensis]|uniref:Uncharacterized protein n=1 Tax=Tengunoibacter tsumagoiensis TaxID=2014871 RepID=A0A402A0P1_9CHLR|nr:HAD family hydrolase [Tengunoibacter tsumagoiensis]GCE12717.1 hypothetical protein KTT_25760 [Tengunoibacter tsumagoiensis]
MSNVIVFDLDGVITSEKAYWMTAGLVLHEMFYSPRYWDIAFSPSYEPPTTTAECERLSQAILPQDVILSFKAHSLNSNWDTCYAGFCVCLIDLLSHLPDCAALLPLRPADPEWLAHLRAALARLGEPLHPDIRVYQRLQAPIFAEYVGFELFERLNEYASEVLGYPITGVFARYSASWRLCERLFQETYLGEELYRQTYGIEPFQPGKPGCIYTEKPLLPVEELKETLEALKSQGYNLGIATGRPGDEATVPLKNYGLYEYFDEWHIMTHAEVSRAEEVLHAQGQMVSLVKPHPYQFLAAAYPGYQPGKPLPPRGSFVVIGDTPSDVRGGKAAGAITVAVLTGALTAEARRILLQTEPDFIVDDVTKVPALLAYIDNLETIQHLQFNERARAELLLQRWFGRHMDLHVDQVTLTPKPVSLNSFNGIYRINDEEYFFKTHVEDQGILEEYYHAEMLFNAGYNIVRPLQTLHEKGRQMVIYPVVHAPVMFDLMRAVETGATTEVTIDLLAAAERRECERLLDIYQTTLAPSSAEEHARAPIHQLFWHRLTGGRLQKFYGGKQVPLPSSSSAGEIGRSLLFEDLLRYQWTINGEEITGELSTLGALIERAREVLQPAQAAQTVVGHGDAHFGNVFLEGHKHYCYFDPAFAGRHAPILDIVKPLFHNVFATWMYFPQDVERELNISVTLAGEHITVEHNYHLTPVRQAILQTKVEHLLRPLTALLRSQQALPENWFEVMRLALMCCPLLTVDLLDSEKRSAAICWLGLSQVMQMGNLTL